jgi:sarcosine oxidase subunit alpha
MNDGVASGSPGSNPSGCLTFTYEDRPVTAQAGQSIGAALYAAGMRIFSRSFKYHRPRGLLCVAGDCPNCLMEVDGRPNVRTCVEPARAGQVVRHQNAWPSLEFDVLRIFDRLDRLLPVGFYYKHFHRPSWLWPIFEHSVRHIAGLGRIDPHATPETDAVIEHRHTEICVIGGGPAGLAAALEATKAGARVLLLEKQPRLGGHLLYTTADATESEIQAGALTSQPSIEILCSTTAFGLYEGNMIGAFGDKRLYKIRAKQVIVCTGGRERPFVFQNNDLPGIFLASGVQRLARWYGVKAGQRAVVVTDHDDGMRVVEDLAGLGLEIAGVVDPRQPGEPAGKQRDWPTWTASVILRARGRGQVQAVDVARLTSEGSVAARSVQRIPCDLVCMAPAPVPANELFRQCPPGPGVTAAGAAAGTRSLEGQRLEGRLRGAEAAALLGFAVDRSTLSDAWASLPGLTAPQPQSVCLASCNPRDRKRFICLCEDVTEKDIDQAVAEGFDHIELLKRYSTATMGPCQGKVCHAVLRETCGRATGRGLEAVGATTSRPPAVPVELSVLAAGQWHPVRRSSLHHWHEGAGARWIDAGLWKRVESYGNPMAEARAVRNGVGLIDVSTLGKIEVVGPDATELLERVYLNRWADLRPGRARYGAMCNEDGILFDDGVGARLGPDRYYLTATTGNAEAVIQWLELWSATWRLNVSVLNRTSALSAMNLAGPHARVVLRQLTSEDLSTSAFPYLGFREALVAGVPCRLFRIGFVGEQGYEIHCSSAQAWHVWEALCAAGAASGLKPFGVEAQRILRLEKGHLIIGQDTDALSNPLEAGLERLVHFTKPFFHGRETLLKLKAMGARSRLVGFSMQDHFLVPAEGCQVVENGKPVGRITSARYSPTLERSLGLAWVPATRSNVGEEFLIRFQGKEVRAAIQPVPFYDREGKRLKS